jgi:hypothetical protein
MKTMRAYRSTSSYCRKKKHGTPQLGLSGRCEQVNPVNRSHVSTWLNVTRLSTPDHLALPVLSKDTTKFLTALLSQRRDRFKVQKDMEDTCLTCNISKMATYRPDDGGSKHLLKVCQLLPDYAVQRKEPAYIYSSPWQPDISTRDKSGINLFAIVSINL